MNHNFHHSWLRRVKEEDSMKAEELEPEESSEPEESHTPYVSEPEESFTPYFLESDDEQEDEYDELGLNIKEKESLNTRYSNTVTENSNQINEESHQVWKPRLENRSTPQAVSHRTRQRVTFREATEQIMGEKEQLRLNIMLSDSSHSSEVKTEEQTDV